MTIDALLFDFDGVLIESEYLGNKHIADFLTTSGYPTTTEEAMARFMGYSGRDFVSRLEDWIGGPLPSDWDTVRRVENERVLAEGIEEVAGAVRTTLGTLLLGGTYRFSDRMSLNVALGVGITRDTPDMTFTARVPINF